jgi:TolB-like protein/thioredoxin-like negative regulator of GroEL
MESTNQGDSRFDREKVLATLERILASEGFAKSERLSSFLRYVVGEKLAGREEDLKEYAIGVSVYRRPDFDPRLDSAVRVDARRLRQKIEEYYDAAGAADELRIEIPKGSYVPRFLPAPATRSAASATSRRRWLWVLAAAVLITALITVAWRFSTSPASSPAGERVVAVLPFANLTGEPALEVLCTGMAEELTHRLAKMPGIRVIARGRGADAGTVAKDLAAAAVLEGSIRGSGPRLRIASQLIRGIDRATLWSESLDVDRGDLLSIQTRMGALIERRFAAQTQGEPVNPDEALLRARLERAAFLGQRRPRAGLEKAIAEARAVLAENPRHARAKALEADATLMLADYSSGDDQRKLILESRRLAEQALDFDAALASPHGTLGLLRMRYEWKWDEAESLLRRAVWLEPASATARIRLARLLAARGNHDEARRLSDEARMAAPLEAGVVATAGQLAYYARRFDEAIHLLEQALDIDPGYVGLHITIARALSYLGRENDARRRLEDLPEDVKRRREFAVLRSWFLARDSKHAESVRELARGTEASSISIAGTWIALGNREQALRVLREGVQTRDASLEFLKVSPVIDGLREDRRLEEVCASIGLGSCLKTN